MTIKTTIGHHATASKVHTTAAAAVNEIAVEGYAVIKYIHADGATIDFIVRGYKHGEENLRGDWYEMMATRNGINENGSYEPAEGSRVSIYTDHNGNREVSWSSGNGDPINTTFSIEILSAIKGLLDHRTVVRNLRDDA